MKGVWLLSLRHAIDNRSQTTILVLCLAVAIFLPLAAQVLLAGYERDLRARSASTPLIAGAKGNRFDLTLAGLYFRQSELDTVPWTELTALQPSGVAIPIHTRFTAQGYPLVGTSPEYYDLRGLRPRSGTLPLQLGDVALGARVAEELGLETGDALFSDQRELYEIAKPPALKMRVCGVLARSSPPDDRAVFVDVKTAWILEGLAHGHDDVRMLPKSYVLGESERRVAISQAMIEYNEVTPDNIDSFHYHGDPSLLPLTAILLIPADRKTATIAKARLNTSRRWQMLVPAEVIDDLLSFVFRIKALFDAIALMLAGCMLLMTILVVLLSMRVRHAEIRTLNYIGCSRFTVAKLYACEIGLIVLTSTTLAAAGTWLARWAVPEI